MLNENKIRLMTKLARYENGSGKEDLRIARYYRSDYLGVALFKNFFLASIGYVVVLLMIGSYFSEYLLDNAHVMNLPLMIVSVVGGYIITITIYSVVVYTMSSLKYSRAKRGVKEYDQKLSRLADLYGKEENDKNLRQENRRKRV
ncbi:MAG: hypothetical protein EOM40_04855 [Clostridia bacterium]|nr:hypothetical protein [Clostridia bacterium]NCC42443.1 hypothetical protein [Clostridia bacterium]